LARARTIFVNAVMGFTPLFGEGSQKMYALIGENEKALKLYGGGDTLTELKNLNPGLYLRALDDPSYYFFTGGGAVLAAIEAGSPYGLKPVAALLK
jgi:phosphoglycerate kinase